MDVQDQVHQSPAKGALGAAAVRPALAEQEPLGLRSAVRALLRCAGHSVVLIARRRIGQPTSSVGTIVAFADGTTSQIYRETLIDRGPPASPAVLVVCFRLRWIGSEWAHALFRLESELNTLLFAGFPGLVSKLWLRHDEHGVYRGFYQWDGPEAAVAYVRALWWVLALVSKRGSVHYAVLPGLDRDLVLADPTLIDTLDTATGGWWRPATSVQHPTEPDPRRRR
jgi:hypothetical protein